MRKDFLARQKSLHALSDQNEFAILQFQADHFEFGARSLEFLTNGENSVPPSVAPEAQRQKQAGNSKCSIKKKQIATPSRNQLSKAFS